MNDMPPEKPNPSQGPKLPQSPMRFSRSLMGWVIVVALGILLISYSTGGLQKRRKISLTEFWTFVDNGQLAGELTVRDNRIDGENSEQISEALGDKAIKFYVDCRNATDEAVMKRLLERLGDSNPDVQVSQVPSRWWETILPQLVVMMVVFFVIWFFLFRRLGAGGGGAGLLGSFGRSKHRVTSKEHSNVTFDDVAGIDEAKEEVKEIIEFLKNPRKFQRLGGRVPRGMLLIGEPGCGKTLLAKANAGEADVPFLSISGSDFVEMFVGVGASRVRDLFKQAKDASPCIIFLDEIDAVGRRRGMGFASGGHDEREQTLNAILVEMDGFDSAVQVIVIAATNRADVLDPALTRPGRFDRQINVPLPDLAGRNQILKIYADKVKCGPDVDLHRMARGTPMFSGADLEAMVNEAAIAATMADKDCIEHCDFEEARDKVRWGRARKSRVIDENEKQITAYHEAGHTLVQMLESDADPLHKVSIIPRGKAGGATFALPEKDRYLYTRKYCNALLSVLLGGRISEEMFCKDISSGASSDIAQATDLAKKMVLDWGMSDKLGFVRYAAEQQGFMPDTGAKDYSDKTAEMIDTEVKRLIDDAYQVTLKTLTDNRDKVEAIANALLKYETLSADEVERIIKGEDLQKPTMNDLIDREQTRTSTTQSEDASAVPPPIPDKDGGAAPQPS